MPDPGSHRSSFSLWRRWAIGLNVVVSAVALLAVVVMINYLAGRHFRRYHWTQDPRTTLWPQTRSLLDSLTNRVRVIVFADPEEAVVFSDVKGLLTEYALACPRLEVEYVNYARNPGAAALVKAQYHISDTTDTLLVIFDTPGRPPRIVREKELSDYDVSGVLQGEQVRRVAFLGEQRFSEALLGLSDTRPVRACYLTGNGEPDLQNEGALDGYFQFAALLREKNIELLPVSLHTNDVPEDCQLLIVAGPRYPVPLAEQQQIDQYLKGGGRALVLLPSPLQNEGRRTGLERLLADWGVEVGDNQVIDKAQSKPESPLVLYTSRFGSHPIVQPLRGSRVALVGPRSVRQTGGTGRTGDSTKVQELLFTSPEGMAVANTRGTVQTNGVIPLAVAVEKGAIAGVSPDRGATRLVVVGESQFLGNNVIDGALANRDFANLAVNWLLDRTKIMAIGPRAVQEYRISLTRSQLNTVAWILLGAMPGAILLVGLLVWVRRRR